jgi:hypothetical protein
VIPDKGTNAGNGHCLCPKIRRVVCRK